MAKPRNLCPEEKLTALISVAGTDDRRGKRDLDRLLMEFPEDARLHFFKGSLLAGQQDYAGARGAMRRAVDLAPDYTVARFQLGFLLLTNGEPHAAQEAWGPLHWLPADHFLRLFVMGLNHLIRDEFSEAIHQLEEGIARNRENAPMNRDMQLIIDEIRNRPGGDSGGPSSSVDLLLQQAAMKASKH